MQDMWDIRVDTWMSMWTDTKESRLLFTNSTSFKMMVEYHNVVWKSVLKQFHLLAKYASK